MELDSDIPAENPDFATPKAPSKKAKGKHKEGVSGAPRPSLGSAFPPHAAPASALPPLPPLMDVVPEEITAPKAAQVASSFKAGPSKLAAPP
jgi:hypothetical protein